MKNSLCHHTYFSVAERSSKDWNGNEEEAVENFDDFPESWSMIESDVKDERRDPFDVASIFLVMKISMSESDTREDDSLWLEFYEDA